VLLRTNRLQKSRHRHTKQPARGSINDASRKKILDAIRYGIPGETHDNTFKLYKLNTMQYTQEEFNATRDLIMAHCYFPADTMEGMIKQLDEILDDIDPRCEDY